MRSKTKSISKQSTVLFLAAILLCVGYIQQNSLTLSELTGKQTTKVCEIHNQPYKCSPVFNTGGQQQKQTSYKQYLGISKFLSWRDHTAIWNTWQTGQKQANNNNQLISKPRIMKVVLMTMNEWPLIKWWTFYHGEMLGFDNLYILDSSDDERCIAFLQQARDNYNVNVIFSKSNLNEVLEEINQIMDSVSVASDLMIKLDTDEFLGIIPDTQDCPDQALLHQDHRLNGDDLNPACQLTPHGVQRYIDSTSFPLDGSKLRTGFVTDSVPMKHICQDPLKASDPAELFFSKVKPHSFKAFFDSRTFDSVDLGSHFGTVLPPFKEKVRYTGLGIFHLHSRCFETEMASSTQAVIRHGYMEEDDSKEVALSKFKALIAKDYPTKESNCTEKIPKACIVPSCHKIVQVMKHMLCPGILEDEYYEKGTNLNEQVDNNGDFADYIHSLTEKYPVLQNGS